MNIKKIALLLLLLPGLSGCGGSKKETTKDDSYSLFKKGNIPAPDKQIKPEQAVRTGEKTSELDFRVRNNTGKTIFTTCFTYIQKKPFSRWRWDKSAVYKLEPGKATVVNVDTIPDDENREYTFGYLAIFTNEKEARDSIYELVDNGNKIDLDKLNSFIGKTIVIDTERYGFKKERLDFAIVEEFAKKKFIPELDFVVDNDTGKTIFVSAFIYQIKDDIRSVWTYDKTPVLKLEPGQMGVIDVDTISASRDRGYMHGFLAIFEEHEEKMARESTYELLPAEYKVSLGPLSKLKENKIVLETEQYGAVGHISDFDIRPASGPFDKKIETKKQTKPKKTIARKPNKNRGKYQLFT